MKFGSVIGRVLLLGLFIAVSSSGQIGFETALEGDLDTMKALLAEDSELIHEANENGKTVLHYAAQGGHAVLVEYLLQAGAEVDSANDAGETPLHYATALGHADVVRVLLASSATVAVFDIDSNTPLHHAALSGDVEIARLLIGRGAEVDAANFYGYKPLDVAYRTESQEMCGYLEAQGGTRIAIEEPAVVHLSGSVYRILFPFGDVSNIGLSAGDEGFLLVDTGFSARAVEKLGEALGGLGDGPLEVIINTHEHPDHIAGNSIGGDSSLIINFDNLEQMVADGVLAVGRDPIKGRSGKSFEVYYTMTFNGEQVRLIPYAGIHTDTDLLVHFTRSGVVHMGDLLILQSFPSVTQKTGKYLELLEKVVDIFPESTRFICGHGREGTVADIAEYHDGLATAAEIIRSSLAAGKKKRTILDERVLQPYDKWGEFIPVLNTEYWFNAVAADYRDSLE